MTALIPMSADQFAAFTEQAVASYAQDNIDSGRWPGEHALMLARADFARLLPRGLDTPDHHLCNIEVEGVREPVGFLWFAVTHAQGVQSAYIYSVQIKPAYRRRGHAKAALQVLEQVALAQGLSSIGLHVFGFNTGAQALYRALGYQVTGINMQKKVSSGA